MSEKTASDTFGWTAFRGRGEILRAVAAEADLRLVGELPTDVPGVTESFRDDLDLVGALQLRWHTWLASAVERHLGNQPMDLPGAVESAWVATARALPGIRAIIDRHLDQPTTPQMAHALGRAQAKERVLLATMAGQASGPDARAQLAGAQLEDAARASYRASAVTAAAGSVDESSPEPSPEPSPAASPAGGAAQTSTEQQHVTTRVPTGSPSFVQRLKAALAA